VTTTAAIAGPRRPGRCVGHPDRGGTRRRWRRAPPQYPQDSAKASTTNEVSGLRLTTVPRWPPRRPGRGGM
jgi:hypothetical protein